MLYMYILIFHMGPLVRLLLLLLAVVFLFIRSLSLCAHVCMRVRYSDSHGISLIASNLPRIIFGPLKVRDEGKWFSVYMYDLSSKSASPYQTFFGRPGERHEAEYTVCVSMYSWGRRLDMCLCGVDNGSPIHRFIYAKLRGGLTIRLSLLVLARAPSISSLFSQLCCVHLCRSVGLPLCALLYVPSLDRTQGI